MGVELTGDEHGGEGGEGASEGGVLGEAGDEGGEGDEVPAGHCVEHGEGAVHAAALGVHADEVVRHERGGGGGGGDEERVELLPARGVAGSRAALEESGDDDGVA